MLNPARLNRAETMPPIAFLLAMIFLPSRLLTRNTVHDPGLHCNTHGAPNAYDGHVRTAERRRPLEMEGGHVPSVGLRAAVGPINGDPSPYGLLGGCTEVVNVTDVHELNGTDLMSTCGPVGQWQDCAPQSTPPFVNPASKPFTRPSNCSFEPVTLTSGITCSTFGISFEEGQERALEQLRLGEQRALEDFFMRRWLCTTAAGNDLTPVAGALSVPAGIGVLENWLAVNYGGQGVIHAPAGAAALLSHSRVIDVPTDGTAPYTAMGNCVVLGAGYAANVGPDGAGGCVVAPAGEAWIYVTPPVRVRRDERSLTITTEQQSVRSSTNDRFALAETTMVVEVACCEAAAVRVSLAGC
jgi:hypothetical protein